MFYYLLRYGLILAFNMQLNIKFVSALAFRNNIADTFTVTLITINFIK